MPYRIAEHEDWRDCLCVLLWVTAAAAPILGRFNGGLTGPSPAAPTTPAWWMWARVCWAFTAWPLWGWIPPACSPFSWGAASRCATASCTALRPCGPSWRKRATPSAAAATAKSSCPFIKSTARGCSRCWTRNSPASSTTGSGGSSWPPGTPSASGRCTTATTPRV